MTKIRYVCGFMFASTLTGPRVLLIQKVRPKWQAGRLNGVGGKIEPGETPIEAMRREFEEEAGLAGLNWDCVAVLTGTDFEVHFFSVWADQSVADAAQTKTDEPLVWVNVSVLHLHPVIANLRVLIPLALDTSGIVKPVILNDELPSAA